MKKVLLFTLTILFAANMFGQIGYNAKAIISLRLQAGGMPSAKQNLQLAESDDLEEGLNGNDGEGYWASFNEETTPLCIYAFYDSDGNGSNEKYRVLETKSKLTNTKIGFKTTGAGNYKFQFSNVQGQVDLYDKVTETLIEITSTTPAYNFTVANDESGKVVDDRFIAFYKVIELEVCFKDNKLQISSNPYTTSGIVVKNSEGTPITGSPFAANATEIDLSGASFATGRYTVEFNGGKAAGGEEFVIIKE